MKFIKMNCLWTR